MNESINRQKGLNYFVKNNKRKNNKEHDNKENMDKMMTDKLRFGFKEMYIILGL